MVPLKRMFTWISGFGLAIVPKCPICYVTYSSSIAICGLSTPHESKLNILLMLSLTALTIVFLIINYRGKRTLLSILLVAIGVSLIILLGPNVQYTNPLYYMGSLTILSGVIINKRKLTIKTNEETTQTELIHANDTCVRCTSSVESIKTIGVIKQLFNK